MNTAVERSVSAGLSLGTVFYGIHFTIFCAAAHYMHSNGNKLTPRYPPLFCISAWVMFILGTLNIVCATVFTHKIWTGGQTLEDGPLEWMERNFGDPVNVVANAIVPPLFLLQDCVLLFRLYTVYANCDYRRYMAWFFSICVFISFVLVTLAFFQLIQSSGAIWFPVNVTFAIIHCAFSSSVNIIMTLAIVWRILSQRRFIMRNFGAEHCKVYTSIVAILIESCALYSSLAVLCSFHATRVLGKDFQSVVFLSLVQTPGICTGLIAIRIAHGRAWSTSTLPCNLPDMRFADAPIPALVGIKETTHTTSGACTQDSHGTTTSHTAVLSSDVV